MRTLATLATLLVGLAFVFWAPAAKAHCPGHEHCGEEPPPPSLSPPVVVDSTGAVVGQVNGRTSLVSVEILFRLDDGRLVTGLKVEANKVPFGPELRSVSLECLGPFSVETGFASAIFLPLVAVGPDDILYIADDLSVAGPVTTFSSWNSELKQCTPLEQTRTSYVEFVPVIPIVQLNFVPPFHIE